MSRSTRSHLPGRLPDGAVEEVDPVDVAATAAGRCVAQTAISTAEG